MMMKLAVVAAATAAVVAVLLATQPADAAVSAGSVHRARTHIGALNEMLLARGVFKSREEVLEVSMGTKDEDDLWFTQQLDHFDRSNNATWQQRYFVNDTFWKGANKGPVILMLGGEGPASQRDVGGHFITAQYAQEYGALLLCLEHRFYGKSMPLPDSSVQSLRYLSSEQALADAAQFRMFINEKYSTPDSPWVVVGGSYSGSLSSWARLKYPTLFQGSLASSAPVHAEIDYHQYLQVVAASLGTECNSLVRQGCNKIQSLLATDEGTAQISKQFNFCSQLQNEKDTATFWSALVGAVSGVVQYSDDNVNYQPFDIKTMCQVLSNSSDPVEGLAKVMNTVNMHEGAKCTEVSYAQTIAELQGTSAGRSWMWQCYTEFAYWQTAEDPEQPFPPIVSLKYFEEMARDIFDVEIQTDVEWTNTNYGSVNVKNSNTAYVCGTVDPWHALGLTNGTVPGPNAECYVIDGTAHCADLYPPRESDVPGLASARANHKKVLDLVFGPAQ